MDQKQTMAFVVVPELTPLERAVLMGQLAPEIQQSLSGRPDLLAKLS
jgi:hypothetical protein